MTENAAVHRDGTPCPSGEPYDECVDLKPVPSAAEREQADSGHTFRFAVTSRMSSMVVGDEHHTDAPGFSPIVLTCDIRAWDLAHALRKAAGLGLVNWTQMDNQHLPACGRAVAWPGHCCIALCTSTDVQPQITLADEWKVCYRCPAHRDTSPGLNVDEIEAKWCQQCGSCDAGMPVDCRCPDEDPRTVIASLIAEIRMLRG